MSLVGQMGRKLKSCSARQGAGLCLRILKSLAASRVSKNGIPQRTILISLRRLRNRMGCVYLLTCLPTGKYYVGKTVKTVRVRWQEHVADVKRGHRGCPYL